MLASPTLRSLLCLLALGVALPAAAQTADEDHDAEARVLATIGRTPEARAPQPPLEAADAGPDDEAEARLLERLGVTRTPPGTPAAGPPPVPDETPDADVPARFEESIRARQREAADDRRRAPDASSSPDGASLGPAGGTVRVQSGTATVRGTARLRTAQNVAVAPGAALAAEPGAWLVFTGADDQTLDTAAPLALPNLALDKTAGRVTLLDDVTVGTALDLSDDLLMTTASLALPGAPLGTGTLGVSGAGTQTLSAPGPLTLASLRLEQAGGTLAVGVPLTVTGTLRHAGTTLLDADVTIGPAGTLDLASGTLTLGDDLLVYGVVAANGGKHARNANRLILAATTSGSTIVRLGAVAGDGSTIGVAFGDRLRADRPHLDGEGWRMIAAPFGNVPFTQLNDDFPTQGATGATIPAGPPILYRWVPSNPASERYVAVGDYNDVMTPGQGYLFYAYATDPLTSLPTLPTVWNVVGVEPPDPVQASLSYHPSNAQRRWNLLGNPYAAPIDWHLAQAGGQFEATYALWDPAASAYAYYSTTGVAIGRAGRYVPAFQGFWARSTGSSPFTLTFQRAWKAPAQDGVHAGRSVSPDGAPAALPAHVRLRLDGEGLPAAEAVALFSDEPHADGAWLAPLAPDHAALFFAGDDETGERLVFDARPPGAPAAFALGAEATRAGAFSLSWDLAAAPEGALTLTDTQTGARVDLRATPSYAFTLAASSARAGLPSSPGEGSPGEGSPGEVASGSRFVLSVGGSVVGPEEGTSVPSSLVVGSPRPNPTAGAVSVRVGLPVAGAVDVRLYDALGRLVSVVASGERAAGWHEVSSDLGSLPPGVYLVRVEAAGTTAVRRLTVMR